MTNDIMYTIYVMMYIVYIIHIYIYVLLCLRRVRSNDMYMKEYNASCPMACEVKAWEDLSSKELRQESMQRGLPEACDRLEVLRMRLGAVFKAL